MSRVPGQDNPDGAPEAKPAATPKRWLTHVILACVGGIAATGMFAGFYDSVAPSGQPDYTTHNNAARNADNLDVPQAVAYAQMKDARFGPNAAWQTAWPKEDDDPTRFYGDAPADKQSRAEVNAQRAQRRAFNGAPPVVPHAIDQQNAASCLVCHEKGLKVGTVIAPRMSHETYANCTQCHVESINRALPPTSELRVVANRFEGLPAPGPGERAWQGAPPTLPHTTWMRENCSSCHGALARKGLRTSHPWRGNCVQCHALSADMDQWHPMIAQRPALTESQETEPQQGAQP